MPLLDVKWRRRLALFNAVMLGQFMFFVPGLASSLVGDEEANWDFFEKTSLTPEMIANLVYLVLSAMYLKWESRQFPKGLDWMPAGAFIGIVIINVFFIFR